MATAANLRLAGLALGLAAATTPASAASAFSKSEAILGGQSALAAILAQQGSVREAVAPLRPASYGIRATPALARANSVISKDAPDVFGTVALKVARTPLDRRWQRVEKARVGGRAATYAASLRNLGEQSRLEAVNRYVNGRVEFADDYRQYHRVDVWATADSTLSRGRGDCEDYAIAKLEMLRAAGFSDRDLYLVILKDLVRRADHAVAVVRSGGRMLVLDNGTDELLESAQVSDYRPILTFAADGAWTHGYRLESTPVEVASADRVEIGQPVPAAGEVDQRSRSASLRAFSTGLSR